MFRREPCCNHGGMTISRLAGHHLLFSAGRGGIAFAVDGPAVGYPTTFYLAYQWTT